jgi:hypothetical protein
MDLLIIPAGIFAPGAGDIVVTRDPEVLATGLFPDPHPPDWRDAVLSAATRKDGGLQGLLIVAGPDDYPGIGPRERYANVMQAVSDLWIFKASIAAVHVALPRAEMPDDPETDRLPFEVAREVIELTGIEELRFLARMADAGPFECVICKREGTARKTTTAVVVLEISGRPPGRERTMVHLAHRTCSTSQVRSIGEDDVQLNAESTVIGTTGLIGGPGRRQRPLLILSFMTSLTAGPGGPDILVSSLVTDGMAVVRDLHQEVPLAPRFSASIKRETISLWDPHGKKLLIESEVSMLPGWRETVRDQGEVTVLAGSGLGLESGIESGIVEVDRITAVARLGRVVGGRVRVRIRD